MTTTPTDAQMKLARECAAKVRPYSHNSALILDGERDGTDIVQSALLAIQATEARAQGLVEALEMMEGIEYKELNLSNYTHDDVCALNNAYVEMQLILTQALTTWRRT